MKSLDPEPRDGVRVLGNGALAGDRAYAVVDIPEETTEETTEETAADGDYVNGKRTDAVHRLRTSVAFDGDRPTAVTVRTDAADAPARLRGDGERFPLPDGGDLSALLSDYFGYPVRLRHDAAGGFPDDTTDPGPTVVSTATIERVAEWTGVSVESVRRRFRANVEISGTEPFWEDRLYAADGPVRFRVGDLELLGTGPCNRCVVPLRDPDTGRETPAFRARLVAGREAELPDWAPRERFDHFFKLAVNTRRPAAGDDDDGDAVTVHVGDPVSVVGPETETEPRA